ncbi:MAG: hypothetical protein K0Q87_5011, partial [Neobacillus sp.]|nr:hypothetical protein [Neobacillus sp.]
MNTFSIKRYFVDEEHRTIALTVS